MASPPCKVSPLKVVEVCRIAPPPNQVDISAAPKSLPLAFFDILWLRFPPAQSLFFYEAETSSFHDSVLPKLKHSLSLSLGYYLPLAGNLIWPENSHKPLIHYAGGGEGVSFTVAESLGGVLDFYGLTGGGLRDAGDFHHLVPRLESSDERAETVAIQVTLFPGSGISIGISSHHAAMDGKTTTDFIKSWARICGSSGELPAEYRPLYDRSVIGDPAGLEAIYVNNFLNDDNGPENRSLRAWDFVLPDGSVRGTFEMRRESVEALRKSLKNPGISAFSLICGYVSVCYFKSLGITSEDCLELYLAFAADVRCRLKPAVPGTYFGNCVHIKTVAMETGILLAGGGIIRAAEAISEAVKSLNGENVLQGAENLALPMIGNRAVRDAQDQKGLSTRVTFVGSPRLEVYSTDFGFGRPKKVEMISNDRTGAICLFDSKKGDGDVEIGFVLKLHEMEAFEVEFHKGLEGPIN